MMDSQAALVLRELGENDGPTFLAAVAASRELHRPWVSPPGDVEAFLALLFRSRRHDHASYLAWHRRDLVGAVNLNAIVRGRLRSAYLGFYAFSPHAGRGWMRQALTRGIDRAFGVHGLHRLEANVRPDNQRSRRLLEGLGFRLGGCLELRVGGERHEHERWVLLADEWAAPE